MLQMEIAFSPTQEWNIERISLIWPVQISGRTVRCVIPQDYLTAPMCLPPHESHARSQFNARRAEIEFALRACLANDPVADEIVLGMKETTKTTG
jgi:hypothetical protein